MNDSRKPRAEATHFMMIAHANIILLVVRTQVWLQLESATATKATAARSSYACRCVTVCSFWRFQVVVRSPGSSESTRCAGLATTLDWEPLPGMVKKRCGEYRYFFAVPIAEAEVTSLPGRCSLLAPPYRPDPMPQVLNSGFAGLQGAPGWERDAAAD